MVVDADKAKLEKKLPATVALAALRAVNLLYVDDKGEHLDTVSYALEQYIQKYYATKDPQEGLNILKENPNIQILLVDICMDKMSGFKFLEHAYKINPYTLNILITGFSNEEYRQEAKERGYIYAYFEKDEFMKTNPYMRQVYCTPLTNKLF